MPGSTFSPPSMPTARPARCPGGAVRGERIRLAGDDTWSDLFVEGPGGAGRAAARHGTAHPSHRIPGCRGGTGAPLAQRPRFAERFELYAAGVELANGFGELTDAVEQRRRFEFEMAEKQRIHGERYPLDEELLAALPLMPEASGVALGFDRLVMLATGARRIDEVMWTPPPRSE